LVEWGKFIPYSIEAVLVIEYEARMLQLNEGDPLILLRI
jgi:hypothetical protein